MESYLQESAGLRRTAPIQSPVPVSGRLSLAQRLVVGVFLVMIALTYLVQLLPHPPSAPPAVAPHRARP